MSKLTIGSIISNYISKVWGLVSVFIFIPIYIHYLGIESYAIIGFYTLILGIISFADSGMSSAVIKEFTSDKDVHYKYSFLILIEKMYILICVIISVSIFVLSDFISSKWLFSSGIASSSMRFFVVQIGVGVSIQLISSLYFGALFGLNRQIRANTIQIVWSFFKSGLVVIIFIVFGSSLKLFFFWQIFCNLFYVLILRFSVIHFLKSKNLKLKLTLKKIPNTILKYIGGMTIIAIISSINIQVDKIIISNYFSLKIFGYYNIASTLSQIPMIMATPLIMSVFPLFSKLSVSEKTKEFTICFTKASFLLNIVVFPVAIILYLYCPEILELWTGNVISSSWLVQIHMVIRFLVIGTCFLSLQLIPFYVLLAKGTTKYTIYQGIIQILIGVPLLFFAVKKMGLIGAGIPWIVINFGALVYLYVIVFNKYLDLKFWLFFKYYLLGPLFVNLLIIISFYLLYLKFNFPFYLYIIISGITPLIINIAFYNFHEKKAILDIKNIFNLSNE